MGRTLPTFNLYLEHEIEQWAPFRRALRREEREAFDALFARAKRHMAEAAYVARPVAFETLIMCILLEQEREIARLRARSEADRPTVERDDSWERGRLARTKGCGNGNEEAGETPALPENREAAGIPPGEMP